MLELGIGLPILNHDFLELPKSNIRFDFLMIEPESRSNSNEDFENMKVW